MVKRLVSMMILTASSLGMLTGCDNSADPIDTTDTNSKAAVPIEQSESVTSESSAKATATPKTIDWSAVASGESPAPLTNYDYPFALDSESVRAYSDYFKVDNATAQHNLTVGMASNEALSNILDEVGGSYVSHELTDGEAVELIIHTTPNINASSYDYVLADDFAKGLVLPIVIKPDGKKGSVDPHKGS
ncbi:hypothetical protein [Psychrobacter sp. CAL346-MNA-CIBAN-0220]|uniref:hypothetical protein n=1 Tax=Psychrobacter sp. CAL346-MNA-CIBAN-0220 TaxID=3140457 RepID=UPI0033293AA8